MQVKAINNSFGLKCKKHSPEILMGFGIVGMITGTVVAVKKMRRHLENQVIRDQAIEAVQEETEKGLITEEEAKEVVKKEVSKYVVEEVKVWAAPVLIEAGSVACIMASNYIMRKRIAGITAAFATVSTAYDTYREHVRERYGEEVDKSILLGEKQVTIEKTDDNGKVKKETVTVADPDVSSIGRYFTKSNNNWSESESFINNFFGMQMSYATDLLRGKGFVILNDLYKLLGFEMDTEEGIVVGKVYDRNKSMEENSITFTWYKTHILDEFGNAEDAYYVDFPGLEIIYGNGAAHRSIT